MALARLTFTPNRRAALFLILLLAAVAAVVLYAWQHTSQTITLEGRMPESGGWNPGDLKATVGEPLRLRLTSGDVVHGFAVGKMDIEDMIVYPGEVNEATLLFDEPGTYTYYCTRWCGANHWRMRGTIEVTDANGVVPAPEPEAPLYLELGLDLDAPHPAAATPAGRPSAAQGKELLAKTPPGYTTQAYYRANSPAQVWTDLRAERSLAGLDDEQLWSLVAVLWWEQAAPASLAEGQELYATNCAACHGENGQGDGVFARQPLEGMGAMEMETIRGHEIVPATDFTDPETMLGASPALLQGKIVRGGMGTGMPYWGSIFTDQQVWALVNYLWTFQFDDFMEVYE